jgi:hypothetical protein
MNTADPGSYGLRRRAVFIQSHRKLPCPTPWSQMKSIFLKWTKTSRGYSLRPWARNSGALSLNKSDGVDEQAKGTGDSWRYRWVAGDSYVTIAKPTFVTVHYEPGPGDTQILPSRNSQAR